MYQTGGIFEIGPDGIARTKPSVSGTGYVDQNIVAPEQPPLTSDEIDAIMKENKANEDAVTGNAVNIGSDDSNDPSWLRRPYSINPEDTPKLEDRLKIFQMKGYYFTDNEITRSMDNVLVPGTIVYPVFGNLNFQTFAPGRFMWDTEFNPRTGEYVRLNYYNPRKAARVKGGILPEDKPSEWYDYTIYRVPENKRNNHILPVVPTDKKGKAIPGAKARIIPATNEDFDDPITGSIPVAVYNGVNQLALNVGSNAVAAAETVANSDLLDFRDLPKPLSPSDVADEVADEINKNKYKLELAAIAGISVGLGTVTLIATERPKWALAIGAISFITLVATIGVYEAASAAEGDDSTGEKPAAPQRQEPTGRRSASSL